MANLRSHPPRPRAWLSLRQAEARDVAIVGSKAAALARAAASGLSIAPGWVLSIDAASAAQSAATSPPASGDGDVLVWARQLVSLAPEVPRWILRSSSPWEDLAGASAAGLLRSEIAPALPEALAAAIAAVVQSGQTSQVKELLRASQGVAVAVLAQPLIPFSMWATVEVRPTDGVLLLDGWRSDAGAAIPWTAQLPWPAEDRSLGESSTRATGRTQEARAGGDSAALLQRMARAVVDAAGAGNWQLEIGEHEGGALLLQVRPAPATWSPLPEPGTPATAVESPTHLRQREDVPRFPMHPGEGRSAWIWDAEHCPTPLCPLLAGWFARWLARLPATHPSRLIDGRWHDRHAPRSDVAGKQPPYEPWPPPTEILDATSAWEREGAPALRAALDRLGARADALRVISPGALRAAWPQFMDRWLAFQSEYFAAPALATARRWARGTVTALERHHPAIAPPPLPETEADRRDRELDQLAHAWADATRAKGSARDARDLQSAMASPDTPALRTLAEAFAAHRLRFAHEAISPWDGRGACLEEDPTPLWREVARRAAAIDSPATPRPAQKSAALARFEQTLAAAIPDPAARVPIRDAALLAVRILAWTEDDDTLLARSYALFRRAARTVARAAASSPLAEREVFDVLPGDLEAQLRSPDAGRWRSAVQRGRALSALWEAHAPRGAASFAEATSNGSPGELRRGLAAAPGRAVGPVRRLAYAQQDGGPLPGEVLVVPTLLPHDAVVLGRVAAVIAESGAPLGHAAVLARERGVPAVVALPEARQWLATAEQVLVDGDQGSVTILPARVPRAASSE